jgi:hypothetical protein
MIVKTQLLMTKFSRQLGLLIWVEENVSHPKILVIVQATLET